MIALPLPAGVTRETVPTAHGPVPVLCGQPRAGRFLGDAVMASGFFGTKEDFRELLALLAAAGVRGWAYDYRGQLDPDHPGSGDAGSGDTGPNDTGPDDTGPDGTGPSYTVPAMADDLREVARAVGGGRPVHVIGHCLGGFVARSAVLAEPSLARSLTLLSCGPNMLHSKHQAMLGGLARIHTNGGTMVLWPLVRKLLADDDTVMRDFWREKLASMNPRWVTGVAESMAAEPDRTGEVRAAGLPALVVHGKRDRRLWSAAEYADLAGRLRAGYQIIERASHSPNMEQPGATASALLAFWARGGRTAARREPVAVTG